ncbi:MAG TPA: HD domain-containing protein [Gemmatimonadaceae bacterium]|nr:HD domain-containing protein [Gemmatimonadaceae bacterium]
MIRGYSDRINHAFAFAAKHHDQQVRKGTRLPYLTHPANVAVILTRYGCGEEIVLAGILHDVIEDCVRASYSRHSLEQRIRDKFGDTVVETVLMVSKREVDDAGTPLSADEQREDYIQRLAGASEAARWVCAADKIHNAGSILADLLRTADVEDRETIWRRFRLGKAGTAAYYRAVYDRLRESAFDAAIMEELERFVIDLEEWAAEGPRTYASGRAVPASEAAAEEGLRSP